MATGRPQGGYWYAHAVWSSELPPTARLVALVIAGAADSESGRLKMSLTTLAQRTGLARSSVARTLTTLESHGWLRRARPEVWRAIKEHQATVYTTVIPPGFPTKASPTVGLGTPKAGPTMGLGLVPYTTKASPTVGLSTTSTNGAAAGSAAAPPHTDDSRCPHGILRGLSHVAGSFICGECEALAPGKEFYDWVASMRARGLTDDWAAEFVADSSVEEWSTGSHLATATYHVLGGPVDEFGDPDNPHLLDWLELCILQRLDPEKVNRSIQESA